MLRLDIAAMALAIIATTAAQAIALNVLDHGATPDGQTDCTAAFQKALDAAGTTGAVVEVPPGSYRLDGTIIVPEGVTLEGAWRGPHTSQLNKGTTLLAFAGRDDEDSAPFISLNTGSTIKGVTIFYPEQKQTDVRPYPWTIQGRGQHYNVIDVTIANAYNGIDCGTYHNEGHHLRNVHMCALRRGVFIDQCTDIGRLENVHIHNVYWWRVSAPYAPTAAENEALQKYTPEHLEGFIIGRTDWEYVSNCFVIWAKVGFHFIRTQSRAGGVANAVITQSGSDIGPLAVRVDSVQQHAGIAFENCQFMSGIEIGPENTGPVKLANCGFWGTPGSGSQLIADGGGTVFLTACHFASWDQAKPCVQVTNGSLLMNSCDFQGGTPQSTHIALGKGVKSAALVGNLFRGGEIKIANESDADVEMIGNVKE